MYGSRLSRERPLRMRRTVELTSPAVDFFSRRANGSPGLRPPERRRSASSGCFQPGRMDRPNRDHSRKVHRPVRCPGPAGRRSRRARRAHRQQHPGQPDRVSTSASLEATSPRARGWRPSCRRETWFTERSPRPGLSVPAIRRPTDSRTLRLAAGAGPEYGTTSAGFIRLNRATGEGYAEGEVKSTYNDLKPEPDGALLAASSPIHVTAAIMTVHRDPALAIYTGGPPLAECQRGLGAFHRV